MAMHIRRREFIVTLGGATLAWPLAARSQQLVWALVGLLSGGQLDDGLIDAVRQGFKELGYIEGRNIAIKYRSRRSFRPIADVGCPAGDRPRRCHRCPFFTDGRAAAKAATSSIPIVFAIGADPVDLGLVSSLNRPGGNITGVTFFINTLGAKRLELLRELVPSRLSLASLSIRAIPPLNPRAQTCRLQRASLALTS